MRYLDLAAEHLNVPFLKLRNILVLILIALPGGALFLQTNTLEHRGSSVYAFYHMHCGSS